MIIYEMPQVRAGRPSKYPWDVWFDSRPRLLETGKDFTCDTAGFRSQAFNAARKRGYKIRTVRVGDDLALQRVEDLVEISSVTIL